MRDVRGIFGRLVVAVLLALCVCVYVLEMSGRWDHSIQDANDEAGFVAIVLCIGVALATAGSLSAHIRRARTMARVTLVASPRSRRSRDRRVLLPVPINSPPRRLRI